MPHPPRKPRPPLLAGLPAVILLGFAACAAGAPDGAPEEVGRTGSGHAEQAATGTDGANLEEPTVASQRPEPDSPFTLGRGRSDLSVEAPLPVTASSADDDTYLLVLDDVELLAPGAFYQVYVGLPEGSEPDPEGPHFVGNLSLYGPAPGERGDGEEPVRQSQTFDVSDAVHGLADEAGWDGELRVTLVRGNPPEVTTADEPQAFLRVGAVSVVRRD